MAKAKKATLSIEEQLVQALVPESEQPYAVPGNWVWTKINICAQLFSGKSPKYTIVPNCNIAIGQQANQEYGIDLQYVKYCNDEFFNSMPEKFFLRKNDVLLNTLGTGTIGRSGIFLYKNKRVLTDGHLFVFRTQKMYLPQILFQFLKVSQENIVSNANGSTNQKFLSLSTVGNIPIPLPPLPEQQRIVAVIESLFEKLDRAKELTQSALDSFKNRKAAILHKAFTGELTAKWREVHGVRLEEWEDTSLGKQVVFAKDKYDPIVQQMECAYIGLEHIQKNGALLHIGNSSEIKSLKTIFKNGDILYGKLRPYLNKHLISEFEGVCSTDILVLRVVNQMNNRFINYLLNTTNFIDYAIENSNGINLPRTSEKKLSKYHFPLPSIHEQQEIVRLLDNMLESEQKAKELCDVIKKIDLMKKAILARAFRGELGTNDPSEESAMGLLREVLIKEVK